MAAIVSLRKHFGLLAPESDHHGRIMVMDAGSYWFSWSMLYIHRTKFNTDVPTLLHMFNHSSQKQPQTYLGIQPSEIKEAYLRVIWRGGGL